MKFLLVLFLVSGTAFAAKPKACPEGFVSNFTCTAKATRDGQRSDENYRQLFSVVQVCQKPDGENLLVQLTTPKAIYPKAKLDAVLGYGHYGFQFTDRGQELSADLTITVSQPPFPGQLTVVGGGEMVYYTCKR